MQIGRSIKKYVILPLILVGSDILLLFLGHYSGSTSNDYTIQGFLGYISTLEINDILPSLVIAFMVVLYVEFYIDRRK